MKEIRDSNKKSKRKCSHNISTVNNETRKKKKEEKSFAPVSIESSEMVQTRFLGI